MTFLVIIFSKVLTKRSPCCKIFNLIKSKETIKMFWIKFFKGLHRRKIVSEHLTWILSVYQKWFHILLEVCIERKLDRSPWRLLETPSCQQVSKVSIDNKKYVEFSPKLSQMRKPSAACRIACRVAQSACRIVPEYPNHFYSWLS